MIGEAEAAGILSRLVVVVAGIVLIGEGIIFINRKRRRRARRLMRKGGRS